MPQQKVTMTYSGQGLQAKAQMALDEAFLATDQHDPFVYDVFCSETDGSFVRVRWIDSTQRSVELVKDDEGRWVNASSLHGVPAKEAVFAGCVYRGSPR